MTDEEKEDEESKEEGQEEGKGGHNSMHIQDIIDLYKADKLRADLVAILDKLGMTINAPRPTLEKHLRLADDSGNPIIVMRGTEPFINPAVDIVSLDEKIKERVLWFFGHQANYLSSLIVLSEIKLEAIETQLGKVRDDVAIRCREDGLAVASIKYYQGRDDNCSVIEAALLRTKNLKKMLEHKYSICKRYLYLLTKEDDNA